MKLSEFKKNYIFTTKIELDDDNFIVLKEPTTAQLNEISSKGNDEKEIAKVLQKILPDCIVESSFENDDGKMASGKEVAEMLKDSSTLENELITTWIQSIPFNQRLQKNQK